MKRLTKWKIRYSYANCGEVELFAKSAKDAERKFEKLFDKNRLPRSKEYNEQWSVDKIVPLDEGGELNYD